MSNELLILIVSSGSLAAFIHYVAQVNQNKLTLVGELRQRIQEVEETNRILSNQLDDYQQKYTDVEIQRNTQVEKLSQKVRLLEQRVADLEEAKTYWQNKAALQESELNRKNARIVKLHGRIEDLESEIKGLKNGEE